MKFDENLLVAVYPFATNQYENFTTEVLVFLLNRLKDIRFDLFAELLSTLTCGMFQPTPASGPLEVFTQTDTDFGRPDIHIRSDKVLIYVEVKTGAALGPSQLERYRAALAESDKETRLLFLLSRRAFESSEALDGAVRWMTIGRLIQSQAERCTQGSEEEFLLHQVAGFLAYRRLLVTPPTSEVSQTLAAYLERSGASSIFMKGRVRSIDRLSEVEALVPLSQLLQTLDSVVHSVLPDAKTSLDSGKSSWEGSPWIGINVNSSHFLFVYLDDPDIVQFETWKPPVDPSKAKDVPGNVMLAYGDYKWTNSFDPQKANPNYFTINSDERMELLEAFYSECLDVAAKVARTD